MSSEKISGSALGVVQPQSVFEKARDQFHRTYALAYSRALSGADHDQAHAEALDEALEAFYGAMKEQR